MELWLCGCVERWSRGDDGKPYGFMAAFKTKIEAEDHLRARGSDPRLVHHLGIRDCDVIDCAEISK